ncbi:probable disease resistance protein At5g66910 [Amaranthus tricolor]|uniref:probable disease resistance protein At5g66910 n=1 Tax=Amaranthus tricolor TaxID=29722 RepID=UPI00258E29C8|nr:probable disease resistance protein At5g66910 [Amaranthus tricolor]
MGDNGNMMSMVSISPDFGFLHLKGNPGLWIEKNTPASHLLVKFLHLDYEGMKDDEELQIGESIGSLSELTELTINGTEFLKCLPKSMATLKKLQKLILEYCINLLDNFDVLMLTFTLTCLKLRDCEITSFPKSLTFLFRLTSLSLFICEFLTELPSSLSLLRRLTHISLKYCERLQSLPYTMAKLLNLKKLSIKGCASLTELPDYLKVTHLKLIYSSINFIPSDLINLRHLHVSVDFLLEASFENLKNSVYLHHLSI